MEENLKTINDMKKNASSDKKQRDIGFEILRIISIILITCVHLLNYAGFLGNSASAGETAILRMLYSFFLTSVNVFVLISAYFLVKSKFKIYKIIKLWLMVIFYTLFLYAIGILFFKETFTFSNLFWCFFPIWRNRYWFFTAYFLIYLISPLLNKIINHSSKKEMYLICLIILLFSYFANRAPVDNILNICGGYNLMWFICLYLIGGTIRIYPLKFKKYIWAIIYIVSTLLIFANYYIPSNAFLYNYYHNSPDYTAPLVLIASVSVFMLFRDVGCKNFKINACVRFVSSATFGIYLFQEALWFKPHLYFDILKVNNYYGRMTSVLYIFAFALAIFCMGFLVDLIWRVFAILIDKIFAIIQNKWTFYKTKHVGTFEFNNNKDTNDFEKENSALDNKIYKDNNINSDNNRN